MTNGIQHGTNGITCGTNGRGPLECPCCGSAATVEPHLIEAGCTVGDQIWPDWWTASVNCTSCPLQFIAGGDTEEEAVRNAVEGWNTRVAVTDHDFAMAVHDGRTWVCVEGALESDMLKPIEGFTRDSIYRDSMREYGEWMEKATELIRDLWTAITWMHGMGDAKRDELRRRLEEFGIEEG